MSLRKWAAILIGALVLAVPLAAEAKVKCPAKPKNTVRAKRMAKKFFSKGGKLAQKEKYAAALDSFLCSLKMKPHENTVYNVAQVSKFVKDQTLVKDKLERFLEKYPNHESRPELEELISSVDGTYVPPEEEQPAAPVVAGGAADAEPAEGATGPPEPEPEGEPEDEPAEEATGPPDPETEPDESAEEDPEAQEVANLFADEEVPPTADSMIDEPSDDPAEEPAADGGGVPPTRIAGYVLLGTAGATLITAIGIQGATGAAKSDALDAQNYDQFSSREDKMHSLQTGATVFWVATGVLAGTGLVLLLLDTEEKDDGSGGVDVEVGAAPGGVVLQGRF